MPLVTVMFGAFKGHEELLMGNALSMPENGLNFSNFVNAWTKGNMAYLSGNLQVRCTRIGTISRLQSRCRRGSALSKRRNAT